MYNITFFRETRRKDFVYLLRIVVKEAYILGEALSGKFFMTHCHILAHVRVFFTMFYSEAKKNVERASLFAMYTVLAEAIKK